MDNKKHIARIKKQIADLRFQLNDAPWLPLDPEDEEAIESEIGNLEISLDKLRKKKKKPMRETYMQDMKLRTLLPVGKIEPRQKVEEIIDTTWGDDGVHVEIDDYDGVVFKPGHGASVGHEFGAFIDSISKMRWFIDLVTKAAKRKVRFITVDFSNDGIRFR